MQQLFKATGVIALVSLLLILSCREIRGPYTFGLVMPPDAEMSISREEVQRAMREGLPAPTGSEAYLAEITVYGYSSGKEVFSYSGSEDEGVSVRQGKGYIDTMVRVKKDGATLKVFFVKGEGASREEMLADLVRKSRAVLNIP